MLKITFGNSPIASVKRARQYLKEAPKYISQSRQLSPNHSLQNIYVDACVYNDIAFNAAKQNKPNLAQKAQKKANMLFKHVSEIRQLLDKQTTRNAV